MVTIASTIDIKKKLPKELGVTNYVADKLHIEITTPSNTRLSQLPTVVNSTLLADGYILFSSVTLADGPNRVSMFVSDNSDLDVEGTTLTKLGSVTIRRVSDAPTEVLV